ncbi:hypothetical protein ACSBR1_026570 [Camellia fascicularis]
MTNLLSHFNCATWFKLEHGTKAIVLFGSCPLEEKIEFADCTVITVPHRIPTVMDCTVVLAISDGKLVEFDEPMKLMK